MSATIIGRNRRQYVINIKADYTVCHRYNPATGRMEAADPADAWTVLENNRSARLVEQDQQAAYTVIRIGSNAFDFFDLRRPA